MASEGWDLEAYNRLAREGNYQAKYSVAKPGQQGERVFEAEGVTKINDALRGIYEETLQEGQDRNLWWIYL